MRKSSNPLNARELSCLQWASIGKTSWETGMILGITERTVNFHIQNACRKLGVHSRQAAITIALNAGLVPGINASYYLSRVKTHQPALQETRRPSRSQPPRPKRVP